MRRICQQIKSILLYPLKLISWPFRKIHNFVTYEPEDTSLPDALSETIQHPAVLVEHLNDLRKHLFRGFLALAIATLISFAFATQIVDWLAAPIGGIQALQAIEVTESVGAFMRVSLLSGITLAFPFIAFELFMFINPGLKRAERVFLILASPAAGLLFIAGMAFAYFILLPSALPFLLNFMGIATVPRPANYIQFVTGLLFWIGIAFQFPLIIFALSNLGLIKAKTLLQGWRYAIVGMAVLAAVVTPTIDPVNMALVMAPMIVLYFFSILLAAFAQRNYSRRKKKEARQPSDN
ncbi:MAG: twin-arginine translocase subunit TatC [Anaerolineales bacterium]|nr:twin-arginine translocase subunit TatC [Anaerolineales bacterium]